jgi:translation initiation factor IF-2
MYVCMYVHIGDVVGSEEALRNALLSLPSNKVRVNILKSNVGEVSLSDVEFAELTKGKNRVRFPLMCLSS